MLTGVQRVVKMLSCQFVPAGGRLDRAAAPSRSRHSRGNVMDQGIAERRRGLQPFRRPESSGFTLVELLVVIAIIGTLVGLLLPAVQAARESARRMSCSNNLKQVGLGIVNYEQARKVFPSGRDTKNQYGVSWAFRLLPYAEQTQIFNAYDKTARVDDVKNSTAMRTPVSTFYCPSRRSPLADRNFDNDDQPPQVLSAAAGGDYAANAGSYFNYSVASGSTFDPKQGGPIHTYSSVKPQQVTDGLSKTFAGGERHIPKTTQSASADMVQHDQGDTAMFASDTPLTLFRDTVRGIADGPDDRNPRKYGSMHSLITNFLFLDGHVEAIDNGTDLTVLRW
jgi:prepilin-type N-terminal cleavage/methylation domain-containing protein/prepilin-type processing-associated H-X9-DG protein